MSFQLPKVEWLKREDELPFKDSYFYRGRQGNKLVFVNT